MSNAVFAEKEPFYTYADYKNWELDPGERYELIDGVAYAMAAPNAYHQAISMELSAHSMFSYAASLAKSIPLPTTRGCFMRKTRATTP